MKRPQFVTGEVYHVYNRGTDKRTVFVDDTDYLRAVHDMFEFNDTKPAVNLTYHYAKSKEVGLPKLKRRPRNLLVEILCFCLMPNHYHMMLRQVVDGGISTFMRKFGTGYTNWFNQRYERSGVLFQGKFKAVHVVRDEHFLYLPHYIHLNPLDIYQSKWKEDLIVDVKGAIEFLDTYRWSSYGDYVGKGDFTSLTQNRQLILGSRTSEDYQNDIVSWMRSCDIGRVDGVAID